MTRPYDVENGLREIARHRANADALTRETARMGDKIADGFRADFDTTLDMEATGKALVVIAASLVPFAKEHDIPTGVIVNMIGLAGENLVRAARARAAEFEGVLCEHVLAWHAVDMPDDYPGTPVPLRECIEFGGLLGEFRLSTREVSGG